MKFDMEVRTQHIDNMTIITPVGEIDLSAAPTLRVEIGIAQSRRPCRLIVDLSEVPYMDSSGVATLVEAMQNARKADCKLILCCLQDKVRSIFEIARLDTVFTIVSNSDEGMTV